MNNVEDQTPHYERVQGATCTGKLWCPVLEHTPAEGLAARRQGF